MIRCHVEVEQKPSMTIFNRIVYEICIISFYICTPHTCKIQLIVAGDKNREVFLPASKQYSRWRQTCQSTINPMCPSNDCIEDTENYLLLCHSYIKPRLDLLQSVTELLQLRGLFSPSNQDLVQIMLCGDERLNMKLLEATV